MKKNKTNQQQKLMKNYKVKATELYPGMDFYHVEGSGAYSGGEIIIQYK